MDTARRGLRRLRAAVVVLSGLSAVLWLAVGLAFGNARDARVRLGSWSGPSYVGDAPGRVGQISKKAAVEAGRDAKGASSVRAESAPEQSGSGGAPKPPPAPSKKAEPPPPKPGDPTPEPNPGEETEPQLTMSGPSSVQRGRTFTYVIDLSSQHDLDAVVLTTHVPEGTQLFSVKRCTDPEDLSTCTAVQPVASDDGEHELQLTWAHLVAGQHLSYRLKLSATGDAGDEIADHAHVSWGGEEQMVTSEDAVVMIE